MVWEQRWHPLREEWVIVAAHRQDRPWHGQTVKAPAAQAPAYAPGCYLCPGNARVGGAVNPAYAQTFVFDNDLPCVATTAPGDLPPSTGIERRRPAHGIARVVCYSPRHDLTLAELDEDAVDQLLAVWQEQYEDLAARREIACVLMFENKGEVVGVSNPHPHGQIYATNFVFKTIEVEANAARRHHHETGRVLFAEILEAEQHDGRRIIGANDSCVAFVPFFARYAYEIYVAPRATYPAITGLAAGERRDLARLLRRVLIQCDNLWKMPFPYVMALHQAPVGADPGDGFHFHIELHPPLRKPDLVKFLAGPEIGGGNFLADTSPEEKAAELRGQPDVHYKQGNPPP